MRYSNKNKISAGFYSHIYDIFGLLLSVFIIVVIVFLFTFRLATVNGDSMNNILLNEDRLIVSELFSTPKSGDIIVANAEKSIGKMVVKRVIATEGQTIKINYENDQVVVDGIILDEPYISTKTTQPVEYWEIPSVIPKGYVFVMGDNRSASMDSRDNRIQLISFDDIVGKAEFIVYPLNRFTYLY